MELTKDSNERRTTMGWWAGWICGLGMMAPCSAQVIQLPTMGNFQVSTTVAVPDGGASSLGGIRSSAAGSNARGFGPLSNRSASGVGRAGSASVHVQIIDLDELDRAILAMAEQGRGRGTGQSSIGSSGATRSSSNGVGLGSQEAPSAPPPLPNPNARTAKYAYMAVLNHPNDEGINRDFAEDIKFYLRQARSAREGRHWASAQLFYEQAWERLKPEEQQRVLATMNQRSASAVKPNDKTKNSQGQTLP